MTKRDWALLVMAAPRQRPLEPVQLQKILFILSQLRPDQLKVDAFYDFIPYDYGPFCRDIYSDAEALEGEGLVTIDRSVPRPSRTFSVTPAGAERAASLRLQLDKTVLEYLDKLTGWVTALSFNQLVSWIYKNFPEMKENSVFKE